MWVKRSRLVWEREHGKTLPKRWVVHHLNGVKDDDRPENLTAMPSKKHMLLIPEKEKRIRNLEGEVRKIRKALERGQFVLEMVSLSNGGGSGG